MKKIVLLIFLLSVSVSHAETKITLAELKIGLQSIKKFCKIREKIHCIEKRIFWIFFEFVKTVCNFLRDVVLQ